MPFTLSHPALIVPLRRYSRWCSFSALAVGSMIPDFEYFLRMASVSIYSHTMAGAVWFDLPLGLLVLALFQNIIREPLSQNLPAAIQRRLPEFSAHDWNRYFLAHPVVVLFSLLIGTISHLVWDSVTHQTGFVVMMVPVLQKTVSLYFFEYPLYRILQHVSTVLGAYIIGRTVWKLPVRSVTVKSANISFWGAIALIAVMIVAVHFDGSLTGFNYKKFVISTISAGLFGLVIVSFIRRIRPMV